MAVHFSLHGSIRNVPQCNQRARQVEELGYESLFTADHQLLCLDPFQALAISAGQTHRLRLGIAVTNMVYRDPTVLASSIATLNEISDGRAILGLGTGDGPVYGLGRKATPMARFEEGVKVIRDLVQGKAITVSTGKFKLRSGKLPVPIYLSVEGPRGLQTAGRVADGVIMGSGFDLRVLQWARERIALGAKEVGRSLLDIDLMVAGMICVDKDGDRARALIRRRLANRAHQNFRFTLETVPPEELASVKRFMEKFDITKPIEERADPNLVTNYLLQRFSIAGTPEECIARVKALEEGGIRHIMVTPSETGYDKVVKSWAKEVMPHFQDK